MHSKRRMQTIQPQILVHRNPTRSVKTRRCRRAILISFTILGRVLIRTSLRICARVLDDAGEDFVRVEDEGSDVRVTVSEGFRQIDDARVPVGNRRSFEGLRGRAGGLGEGRLVDWGNI